MLEFLITSKTKRNLLKLFLTNPDRSFYVRETAKLTNESLNAVRRELGYLEKAGLLRSLTQGESLLFLIMETMLFR